MKDDTDDINVGNTASSESQIAEGLGPEGEVEGKGANMEDAEQGRGIDINPEFNSETSAGEISAEERLADAEQLAQEYQDKYLRSLAELENFRKRALRERADILRYAGEGLARDILEVVDTLELALSKSITAEESIADGVKLIADRFAKILESHSISSRSCKGEIFNPQYLEALATVPTAELPAGTVIEELRKAYFFKDKLLRPGQVVVAAEPLQSPKETEARTGE